MARPGLSPLRKLVVAIGSAAAVSLWAGPVAAQSAGSLDMDVNPNAPVVALPSPGSLDLAAPAPSAAASSTVGAGATPVPDAQGDIRAGMTRVKPDDAPGSALVAAPQVAPNQATVPAAPAAGDQPDGNPMTPVVTTTPAPTVPSPDQATVSTAPAVGDQPDGTPPTPVVTTTQAPPVPPPVMLADPHVVDTADLATNAGTFPLYGIVGQGGDYAQDLQGYITKAGNQLACDRQATNDYICVMTDGMDVAAMALFNGAAQAKPDAPAGYHELEAQAQAARRGIWASLPPPPVQIKHPTVRNTATLVADGQTYPLDGVEGLSGKYAVDLQAYIVASGDTLSCQAQGQSGQYVCLLPNGTDIAKAALLNGAARVTPDAPDSYRVEQGEALAAHRGFWLHPPRDVLVALSAPRPAPAMPAYAMPPGDQGDGVAYVGGQPTAQIAGETVFLVMGGALGWGYYDHFHHWHEAPHRFARHMERFHPGGRGLRGYRPEARRPMFAARHPAFARPDMPARGFARPVMPVRSFARPTLPARSFARAAPAVHAAPARPAAHACSGHRC